jgi:hypothetical protein
MKLAVSRNGDEMFRREYNLRAVDGIRKEGRVHIVTINEFQRRGDV